MNTILKSEDLAPGELVELLSEVPATLQWHENEQLRQEKVRFWLDAPDGWTFAWWPGLRGQIPWNRTGMLPFPQGIDAELLSRATAGRLFAPSGELRWRKLPALGKKSCRTVFLGDSAWAPARLSPRSELESMTCTTRKSLLWGQQTASTPDAWIQLSIPHRLNYPVDPPDPAWRRVAVQATLEIWIDTTGVPHFVRLVDLHACKGD